MDFENKTAGEVLTAVELYHRIDVVFPETAFDANINGARIVFSHKVEAVEGFYICFFTGEAETKVGTKGWAVEMVVFTFVVNVGKVDA